MKFATRVQSRWRSELAFASIALSSSVTAAGCGARSGLLLFDAAPLSSGGTTSSVAGFGGVSASAGIGGTLETAGDGAGGGTNGGMSGIGGMSGVGGAGSIAGFGGLSGAAGTTATAGAGGALCAPGMRGCALPICGDGVIEAPEACDDGNTIATDACTNQCKLAICGDGVVWSGHEECDDGNALSGDGCSASCTWEPVAITVGFFSNCARAFDGALKCWGGNFYGELGLGDALERGDLPGQMGDNLPTVSLGTGRSARAVTTNDELTCALLDDATIKCWGENFQGELGQGDTTSRGTQPGQMGDNLPAISLGTGRTATAVAAGGQFACALLDNGAVKCWGVNVVGELGLGDTTSRGDQPGQMGDKLPAVSLGTGRTATAIATGDNASCALLDNGAVKCWGYNVFGALGLGDSTNRGNQPNQMGDNLPAVSLGTGRTAKAIAVGSQAACALLDNDTVKCWGWNSNGQLGLGDTTNRGDQPGQMGDDLPTVNLGTSRIPKAIAVGSYGACALLDNGTVKCWGDSGYGQLGLGNTANHGDQPNEMGDNLPAVDLGTDRTARAIAMNDFHTCALLDNGTVKCWGRNDSGQLGLGDTTNRGNQPNQMGDNLPAVDLIF